jgi:hypothetical protein
MGLFLYLLCPRQLRLQRRHAREQRPRRALSKSIAELIDQSNRQGDFAIPCTAKTKIALSRFKRVKGFNGRFE